MPPSPATQNTVRNLLREAGFPRVGIARATPGSHAARFEEWLRQGYAGGMDYLARQAARRADPDKVLPGVRSIIAVLLPYRDGSSYGVAAPRPDRGEIASYARGADYHRVLEKRLRRACVALRERLPGAYRYYADTGPVLEKAWAERAGIGWIGKNTCSIDPEHGSFFFLGAILTTLELTPDAPAVDHCGSCRLCIDACPTGAFPEPYVLDARRCISYLTIEERGEIAPELEAKTGNLVFGCDICQEVCPWNAKPSLAADPELSPRAENVFPELAELAKLDAAGFRARFPQSAVRRAGFRGFLRNVIIALGNSRRPELAGVLDELAARRDIAGDPLLSRTLERACKRLRDTS